MVNSIFSQSKILISKFVTDWFWNMKITLFLVKYQLYDGIFGKIEYSFIFGLILDDFLEYSILNTQTKIKIWLPLFNWKFFFSIFPKIDFHSKFLDSGQDWLTDTVLKNGKFSQQFQHSTPPTPLYYSLWRSRVMFFSFYISPDISS